MLSGIPSYIKTPKSEIANKMIKNFFKINKTSSFVSFTIYGDHETKKYVEEKKETKKVKKMKKIAEILINC